MNDENKFSVDEILEAERKAKAALDAIDFPSLSNRKCTL